jgi:hypothetical protein
MALIESRLRMAEERAGVGGSNVEAYMEAYKRFYRGDDKDALNALPPYKPGKGAPTGTELFILAMSEVDKEYRLKGEEFVSWLVQDELKGGKNEQP